MKISPSPRSRWSSTRTREDLQADRGVKHRDGLVADQPLRLEHQRRGDRDALALTTGELMRIAVEVARGVETDVVERAPHVGLVLGLRHALDEQWLGDDRAKPSGED